MEPKKNSKANLEKSRGLFFQIGLVVALGVVFFVFSYSTKKDNVEILTNNYTDLFEQEEIINTKQEPDKKIIPPMPKIAEVLVITDDIKSDEEFEVFSSEITEEEAIELPKVVLKKEAPTAPIVIVDFAEKMPEFPGGEIGLRKFLADKIKYPSLAVQTGLEGKVYIRFCVTKDGKVDRVQIARGVDPMLDKEAMRVVKLLPKWKPGESGGQKVNVWYTVPIAFKLGNK